MEKNQKTRVLIAEDDYLVGEVIKRALKQIDFELVGKASNGIEAVEMAASLRPDVILMDIQMPKLDGLEAARQIQGQCPIPIVILTAHESRSLVDKASEAGVAAYLTKPPKRAEIERAIIVALARFEDMMELRRLNAELKEALAKVKTLSGLLPICMHCKKIRDDKGDWNQIEHYIHEHSEAEFSHSICEECFEKYHPE
jgi:AmiR/NasT family two-component response regulator